MIQSKEIAYPKFTRVRQINIAIINLWFPKILRFLLEVMSIQTDKVQFIRVLIRLGTNLNSLSVEGLKENIPLKDNYFKKKKYILKEENQEEKEENQMRLEVINKTGAKAWGQIKRMNIKEQNKKYQNNI